MCHVIKGIDASANLSFASHRREKSGCSTNPFYYKHEDSGRVVRQRNQDNSSVRSQNRTIFGSHCELYFTGMPFSDFTCSLRAVYTQPVL
ncbi:hypothetical protein WN55_00435 [Dufourea novaeangliae]|uniref:Uncharacterized protein n=1 Tax=Dufourea novaeangliae TaxID=178035 RepID=A0A154PFP4_DUFNO|nr:hypothetical protein WN55_00435 [Dufourea novaeangliae]